MPQYEAFLLRIWRGGSKQNGRPAIQLQHLPDGEILRFNNFETLLSHLCIGHTVETNRHPMADHEEADEKGRRE
jgi:hypothetical protein